MWVALTTVLLLILIGITVKKIFMKMKETPVIDPKSLVTSICFLLIGIVNLAGYWFGFLGITSMALTVALLITGAYFTRYLQTDHARKSE
ncbi:hypothetical protein A1A1_01790 [Planococcus antarcticus DSM 14505]|uniref:Uncharacterized protein n=1 Tax=Planococcus antarcticus DSM 14505 TaxID=1185653 RepID=A0A1C7DDS4_9BACL|nr:hypothetical protein [Planococcus antarcticus]ANU09594.1 hypothetical protein BBH88_04405 [Planococcus antarcticus DSM 14505]EIM08197.1 hypothetical protein A1A1_01790 [Planococcus antarcticus DSM 14505]